MLSHTPSSAACCLATNTRVPPTGVGSPSRNVCPEHRHATPHSTNQFLPNKPNAPKFHRSNPCAPETNFGETNPSAREGLGENRRNEPTQLQSVSRNLFLPNKPELPHLDLATHALPTRNSADQTQGPPPANSKFAERTQAAATHPIRQSHTRRRCYHVDSDSLRETQAIQNVTFALLREPLVNLLARAAIGLLSVPFAHAQLTLPQAVERAVAAYPSITAANEQTKVAAAQVNLARTAYLPKADALAQANIATHNNVFGLLLPQPVAVIPSISGPVLGSNSPSPVLGTAVGILVNWEPFDFGRRRSEISAAESSKAKAAADVVHEHDRSR